MAIVGGDQDVAADKDGSVEKDNQSNCPLCVHSTTMFKKYMLVVTDLESKHTCAIS